MEIEFNIEEVAVGDKVEFKSHLNHATSPVKEVNSESRLVKINFFEDPKLAIDRIDKWVSFDEILIVKKAE